MAFTGKKEKRKRYALFSAVRIYVDEISLVLLLTLDKKCSSGILSCLNLVNSAMNLLRKFEKGFVQSPKKNLTVIITLTAESWWYFTNRVCMS